MTVGSRGSVVLAVNACWNVVNFRSGLVRGLLEAGYTVTVVAPRDEHTASVETLGCRFVEMPMAPHGREPAQELALLARFVRLVRQERPSCVLAYTPKPNIYASLAAAMARIPYINNVPGLGLIFNETGMTTRLLKLLYRIGLRRSSKVFFQNGDDLRVFLEARLVPPAIVDLLPGSGVDLARFAPAPGPQPGEPFTFLLVARLLWEKGIAEYVEAGRIVRRTHPDARIRMLGFIDDASAAGVPRQQIEAWQHEGAIEYLGSAADVRPHVAVSDCIVLPSYYREGTPRTLLEAAAMAKPIITSDMPGCRDVVDDGANGFIVPPRDIAALANRMNAMVALSPEQRRAMGYASRAKAAGSYDEQLVIRKYLDAIEAVVGGARSGR